MAETTVRVLHQQVQMLKNLRGYFDRAEAFAAENDFDAEALLTEQLYPDMFTLARQVQSACDTLKFGAARLSGTEAPSDPDTETTFDELRARIDKTIAFVEGIEAGAFEGAEERAITLPFMKDMVADGVDYLHQFEVPNFYFHMSTAHCILRHKGVDVGKIAYIGRVDMRPKSG